MKAIILAAGRGSRMKGLTEAKPKCMVELQGRPLLDWQVESLRAAGIRDIGIVGGYRKELLVHRDLARRFENIRWSETNMVRSLMEAGEWLESAPCIVSYGDIFYDAEAVTSLIACKAAIALTYDVNFAQLWQARQENPLDDLETFRVNPKGDLLAIGEKPRTLAEIEGQYMGLLRFAPPGWEEVRRFLASMPSAVVDKMDMTTLLRHLLSRGVSIRAVPFTGRWGEVDNESDLLLYEAQGA